MVTLRLTMLFIILSSMHIVNAQNVDTPTFKKGFGHFTEIGALAATRNRPDNVTTAAFSFQMVNGYHFSQRVFGGLGTALDLYATQTILPVFASLRADLVKKARCIPYAFTDGGYGIALTASSENIDYQSGPMFAIGAGMKFALLTDGGFHINFGYRVQKGAVVENETKNKYTNERIALRAGFYL